jgi:peptide deformylase
MKEGCLSWKGLCLNIARPTAIKVRFATPDGNVETHSFTGMTARCFQHEMDHLDGIMFVDKVSKLELDIAKRKARKLLR